MSVEWILLKRDFNAERAAVKPKVKGRRLTYEEREEMRNESMYADYGNLYKISEKYNDKIDFNDIMNFSLLPHQKAEVAAAVALEKKMSIDFNAGIRITTRAGVLSDNPGTGKTFIIMAIICLNRDVPKNPNYIMCNSSLISSMKRTYEKCAFPTLIFVGGTVLNQWKNNLSSRTKLKVCVIDGVLEFRKFNDTAIKNGKVNYSWINGWDVILIKNGTMVNPVSYTEADLLKNPNLVKPKGKVSMIEYFSDTYHDISWKRVILDDFDVLGVSSGTKIIPAFFTWFVSATTHIDATKPGEDDINSLDDVRNYRNYYSDIWKNKILFNYMNIGSTPEYLESSTNMSMIDYLYFSLENKTDILNGAISFLNSEIGESVNGDALKTAAELAGSKLATAADIFEKLLDDKFTEYKELVKIEAYIPMLITEVGKLPNVLPEKYNPLSEERRSNLDIHIRTAGRAVLSQHIKKIPIEYRHDRVIAAIDENKTKYKEEKAKKGIVIERVKENLREGDCPITFMPLKDSDIFIMKCCNKIISSDGIEMMGIKYQGKDINGTCPNCRAPLRSDKIIVVSKNINIDDIINENIDDEKKTEDLPVNDGKNEEIKVYDDEIEKGDTKYGVMMRIVLGMETKPIKRNDMLIPKIVEGNKDLGQAKLENRKIIIYTSFLEATNEIEKRLLYKKISFERLHGSASQIDTIANKYRLDNSHPEAIKVILISGPRYCAGLDLQNTTDLIFMHKVIDVNIETQIAGRAARVGRKNNLHITYILYKNEYELQSTRARVN